jgi:hypothetical protein
MLVIEGPPREEGYGFFKGVIKKVFKAVNKVSPVLTIGSSFLTGGLTTGFLAKQAGAAAAKTAIKSSISHKPTIITKPSIPHKPIITAPPHKPSTPHKLIVSPPHKPSIPHKPTVVQHKPSIPHKPTVVQHKPSIPGWVLTTIPLVLPVVHHTLSHKSQSDESEEYEQENLRPDIQPSEDESLPTVVEDQTQPSSSQGQNLPVIVEEQTQFPSSQGQTLPIVPGQSQPQPSRPSPLPLVVQTQTSILPSTTKKKRNIQQSKTATALLFQQQQKLTSQKQAKQESNLGTLALLGGAALIGLLALSGGEE